MASFDFFFHAYLRAAGAPERFQAKVRDCFSARPT